MALLIEICICIRTTLSFNKLKSSHKLLKCMSYLRLDNCGDVISLELSSRNIYNNFAFISQIESKKLNDTIVDDNWVVTMQEKVNQLERNEVLELVPRPNDRSLISTKWVFKNKMDENGIVIIN